MIRPVPCALCGGRGPHEPSPGAHDYAPVSRFVPFLHEGSPARRRGWYVEDALRSTPGARVVVGARHETQLAAVAEARRLAVEEARS